MAVTDQDNLGVGRPSFLRGLFSPGAEEKQGRPRLALPDSTETVYAIGDVHGCLDLLERVEERIAEDASRLPEGDKAIVMLGDLIDRGPDSAGVIEHVMRPQPDGFRRYVLAGNHETAMLDFLDNPATESGWLHLGGGETLASYGVTISGRELSRKERQRAAVAALASIPDEHIRFLRELPVSVTWNRYLFAHAGVRPNVPLARQTDADLTEIRHEFTDSNADHGLVVVHGHTPVKEPVCYPNRVAIDLAPYATGRLAAARLDERGVKFLTVA